jgi:predicted ATP-grasp superfamily ATP-dependent carboligase
MRSLGRLGVPVYGVDADRFTPAFFSKYCRGKFVWDIDRAQASASLHFLNELGSRIGQRSVLIPTSDMGTMFVADHAGRLAEKFVFPERSASLVRSLCSKREMYHLARKWNVLTPENAFPKSKADVLSYLDTAHLPILVKPIYNRSSVGAGKPWRMFLAHSAQVLLDCYDAIEDSAAANVMLQEYIPGADKMTWAFNGYFDRNSECRLAFTGRKLRNYPSYFGQASLGICERNDDVKDIVIKFMKDIGYAGPLDIGFRYDARDGNYKLHDVNPRLGAMFRAFVGNNGIDVSRALYQDMTNQPIIRDQAPEGRKWIVEDVDWIAALRYWRDGNLSIKDWLRSISGINERAFFSRDDPWPIAGICMLDAKRVLLAGLNALRKMPARANA